MEQNEAEYMAQVEMQKSVLRENVKSEKLARF